MAANQEQLQLLDQLQKEVNSVLENTGRIFAAATKGNKSAAAAQASRLKSQFPGSLERFHETLDKLEDELALARTVLRRDLAVLREKSGQAVSKPAPVVNNLNANITVAPEQAAPEPAIANVEPEKQELDSQGPGAEAEPSEPDLLDGLEAAMDVDGGKKPPHEEQEAPPPQPNSAEKASEANDDPSNVTEKAEDTTVQQPNATTAADNQDQGQDQDQHQDQTQTQDEPQDQDDDQPPDTAMTTDTRGDLDSLFNDPASAGGNLDDLTMENLDSGDGNGDGAAGFDFGDFTNLGNDTSGGDDTGIEGLLPGLQDYANTQPTGSGETDFSTLFAADPLPGGGSGDDQGGAQGDTTFDDIMNFASFNGDEYSGGNGGGGNNNTDFDFNFE